MAKIFFLEKRNYEYFLYKYVQYIFPIADTFAYCLLGNHFHSLIRIKTSEEQSDEGRSMEPSFQFSKLFNAYAKAINKTYRRTGSLFEHPFHRNLVDSEKYLLTLVAYIHHNPQKHGLVKNYCDWPYSSYPVILSEVPTFIKKQVLIDWFDGKEQFKKFHSQEADALILNKIEPLEN